MKTEAIARSLVTSMVNDLGTKMSETVLMRSLEYLRENMRKTKDKKEQENEELL